jgi:dCTP deaminase
VPLSFCAFGQGDPARPHDRGAGGGGRHSGGLPLCAGQIQPASLDLRLGAIAYRVRASFLPGPGTAVARRIAELKLHEFALTNGAVLETGCVYIVPLLESLALPADIAAATNPKSSTGRLDVFTRVIADETRGFDRVAPGYHGPLYAEISPKTFPVLVREGSRLSQMRLHRGDAVLNAEALRALHAHERLVDRTEAVMGDGVAVSVDLSGAGVRTPTASSAIAPSAIPRSSRSSAATPTTSPTFGSRSARAPTKA